MSNVARYCRRISSVVTFPRIAFLYINFCVERAKPVETYMLKIAKPSLF